MAENGLSTLPKNVDDELVIKEPNRNNTNTMASKTSDEISKKSKSSFFSQLRKKFSFRKKTKSKDTHVNTDQNNVSGKQRDSNISGSNSTTNKSNCNNVDKSENRFSVIRRSFGKGKSKDNGSNKDLRNSDQLKNRDSVCQNQVRPQSMHIANSYPPRNGLLASFGWYWGPLSRSEATHRLRHQEDGSFLVRDSEGDPNKFTLSFKGAGQIFHNRILQHQNKYAFLPDEEFDTIPDLIVDAMRRSATSAYCFSRSTDVVPANATTCATESNRQQDSTINGNYTTGNLSTHHKHEVRLLKPISRFSESPRSLSYLCRFIIRQYTRFQDLCKLVVNPEMLAYLEDHKYNL